MNGTPSPTVRYQTDWSSGDYHRVYEEFLNVLALNTSPTVNISPELFAEQCCIWALDLTGCPQPCNNSHVHSAADARGLISAEIIFSTATTKALQLVTFRTNHKVLTIDSLKSVSLDY